MHLRPPRAGVTLLELLIAVLIMNIGIIGTINVLASGWREQTRGNERSAALAYAQSELSRIRSLPIGDIAMSSTPAGAWTTYREDPAGLVIATGGTVTPSESQDTLTMYRYVYCAEPGDVDCQDAAGNPYNRIVRIVVETSRVPENAPDGIANITTELSG